MNVELTASVVTAYIDNHIFMLSAITIILIVEAILRTYLTTIRATFNAGLKVLTDDSDIENLSIEYYSKKQRVILTRTVIIVLIVVFGALYYDIRSFSFFAVALGAIIMTFKETIISVISYFNILRTYKIGDDIKVDGVRGEILNIRPTFTIVLGKDDDGEYNGKVTTIQNYSFVLSTIERHEMKSHSYLLTDISIPFDSSLFDVKFDEFLLSLKKFLNELLPTRGMNNVGYYRTYAGLKYKLTYSYDEDTNVVVKISFISKPRRISDRKESIIKFVESLKK